MVDRTVTTQEPWGPQQIHLENIFSRAQGLLGRSAPYYERQSWVDFAPQTELALGLMQQRALGGSPYEQSNQSYLTRALSQPQVDLGFTGAAAQYGQDQGLLGYSPLAQTAQGSFVGANPYLNQQFGQAAQQMSRQFQEAVLPGINATFGDAGMTGGGQHQAAIASAQNELSQGLGGLAANLYGDAYQQERANQLAAAGQLTQAGLQQSQLLGDLYGAIDQSGARASALVPMASQLEYGNIDRLGQVGGTLQDQANRILQDDMARYAYFSGLPMQQLQDYAGFVSPQYGGVTTVEGGGGSRFGKALGGAMTGASIGGSIPGVGPYGAIIGGGIGLLGGLIG